MENVCLAGVVLANEAGDALLDLDVEAPKIPKVLNKEPADKHPGPCISAADPLASASSS
jgi:hypothetical protein